MDKTKEEILESQYSTPQMFNLIYNLMMMDQLRDVYLPFMEAMKSHFKELEEFEKCENIKNFLNLLKNSKKNAEPNA